MRGKLESSSQQPKDENVIITIEDQIQLVKKKFSIYNANDKKTIGACNYRVHEKFRKGNEDAYTPRAVSIGPIHHGRPQLQKMERYKWKYLGKYLGRFSAINLDNIVRITMDMEADARLSYLDNFDTISKHEFSEMIMLDFTFMIEFFFQLITSNEQTIPLEQQIVFDIIHDMMLLENQFPQRLATHLFHNLYEGHDLGDLILRYFWAIGIRSLNASPKDWDNATDKVDFLVKCHDGETSNDIIEPTHIKRIHNATELQEAGVKFLKASDAYFLLDVKLGDNGVLQIPVIQVNFSTETLFRNMIASEQSRRDKPNRVSGYVQLMATLLRTPEDVLLLQNCGIIENYFIGEEGVTRLFDKIAQEIVVDWSDCYFWGIYKKLHAYSENYWHQWRGSCLRWRRKYFSNPWTIISAASILLVLTVIQTACSIIQL
ncbi:hypothetical protein LguiB_027696 [Lonicera macranthoides]